MKNKLPYLLLTHNLTKTQLANELGVSRVTISRICNSKSPSIELGIKIAKYFKMDVTDIFFEADVKQVAREDTNTT